MVVHICTYTCISRRIQKNMTKAVALFCSALAGVGGAAVIYVVAAAVTVTTVTYCHLLSLVIAS